MRILIYGLEGDERIAAYADRRRTAGDEVEIAKQGEPGDVLGGCDEVIISAELPYVDRLAAQYKMAGITVTTLGRRASVEKQDSESEGADSAGTEQVDPESNASGRSRGKASRAS